MYIIYVKNHSRSKDRTGTLSIVAFLRHRREEFFDWSKWSKVQHNWAVEQCKQPMGDAVDAGDDADDDDDVDVFHLTWHDDEMLSTSYESFDCNF